MKPRLGTVGVLAIIVLVGFTGVAQIGTADETFGGLGGPCGVYFSLQEDGLVHYTIWGSRFSAYIVTEANFEKAANNQSFAYIAHLSVENVTAADVSGDLPKGRYVLAIYILEEGSVHYSLERSSKTSNPLFSNYGQVGTAVVATAILVSVVMSLYYRRKQR